MKNGVTIVPAGTITEIKSQTESVEWAPWRISQSQFRYRPCGVVELGDVYAEVVDYDTILAKVDRG